MRERYLSAVHHTSSLLLGDGLALCPLSLGQVAIIFRRLLVEAVPFFLPSSLPPLFLLYAPPCLSCASQCSIEVHGRYNVTLHEPYNKVFKNMRYIVHLVVPA